MAYNLLRTLLDQLEVLRAVFTRPGFDNMLVVFAGWVQTCGVHAVTQALVATEVAGRRHHEAFHRFFSRGTWNPDEMGHVLLGCALRLLPVGAAITLALDDTLAPKKGPQVFGMGNHLDAVRSTRRFRIFSFGHCWVVLAIRVPVPFSHRVWALPLLFRLYRNTKECTAKGHAHRKKTELAREIVDLFLSWVGERRVELAADSAYCNDTIMRDLPRNLILLGSMRPDAVLTTPPKTRSGPKGGRPRKRGDVLPKPQKLAHDESWPWQRCEANLYGQRKEVKYKEICGQWYQACGTRLLRIVIVHVFNGTLDVRVFFSTDAAMTVPQILEGYASRWSIEVMFRDLKQLFGFADSSARKRAAVERTAPFVGLTFTLLVVWFAQNAWSTSFAIPPLRPWYRHKRGLSFADVLRTAQRALAPLDVLDPRRSLDNLHQLPRTSASPPRIPLRRRA